MRKLLIFLIAGLSTASATAQYRCVENGKPIFTDRPCSATSATPQQPVETPKVIVADGNNGYGSPYGEWRGQVQYLVGYQGKPVNDAHAVEQTTISIDPKGKVTGTSSENGCRMKGVASPGMAPTLLNLDVTLSGCKYEKLNRRLFGTLALYPAEKHAQFAIRAQPVDLLNPGWSYDIKGTVRR